MAIEASVKPNTMYNFDDDDDDNEPLVFKRNNNTASNRNQSNSNTQKIKTDPSAKASLLKSPLTSPNASITSGRMPPMKSPVVNLKTSTSLDDWSKQSWKHNKSTAVKEESQSLKDSTSKHNSDDKDSDDDKPLTSRLKGNSNKTNKGPSASTRDASQPPISKISIKRPPEESDDEAPISSREGNSNKTNKRLSTSTRDVSQLPISKISIKCPLKESDDGAPISSSKGNSNKANKGPSTSTREPQISKMSIKRPPEELDDEGPISLMEGNSNKINKGPSTSQRDASEPPISKISIKCPPEESDDEAPISSRLALKSKAGASGSKPGSSNEKEPLTSKIHQNGSTMKGQQQISSQMLGKRPLDKPKSEVVGKRPLDKCNSPYQSLSKRPKLLGGSTSVETKHVSVKTGESDDDDHISLDVKMRKPASSDTKPSFSKQKTLKVVSSSSKKPAKKSKKATRVSEYSKSSKSLPSGDGQKKWTTLVHNGVIFPPPYKPHGVKILYNGKPVDLTSEQEEVATMFAVMKDTDYWDKLKFKENFWNDWQKLLGKNHAIKNLDRCDFEPIYQWHLTEKDKKKQLTAEEKKALKEEKLKQEEKYMWAIVDGVKEKVGNFRVEPPGLFRGRGEHPKMGKLKKRIRPSDITINIGKDASIPECPIAGESWKEVRHDNTVTWLAFWNDPINPKEFKYVFLAASSSLKGQSDKEKYEKARKLKDYIKNIRAAYTKDFTHKDITKRQIAVATYLIDKLALRAGNEKDDDEADTVGCCTLKVGNVECIPPNKLKFDFLGKDSIQYVNTVEVELPVYKAIGQFQTRKDKSDDLFDQLDTTKLNAHLKELMPGLTAKVFRTYNASITLDEMLSRETKDGDVAQKVGVYQHANKEVAIICNHQRSVSRSHGAQITKLTEKINELKGVLKELKIDLDRAKKGKPPLKDADGKQKRNLSPAALEKKIAQTNDKIEKMERDMQTKEDLKNVALGTSKINYLDPRITVAWCKRHEVPIEKVFNKSLLAKFAWAMDVDPDFRF